MEEVKRRVLDLIAADRVRRRGHFRREAAKDRVQFEDAVRVLRNGAVLPSQADFDSVFGTRYRFRGRDDQGRIMDVVVSIDDESGTLWLHTVFLPKRR